MTIMLSVSYPCFVKGGVGIRYSVDELAANCLEYEGSEPPRLVSLKLLGVNYYSDDRTWIYLYRYY